MLVSRAGEKLDRCLELGGGGGVKVVCAWTVRPWTDAGTRES